MRSARLKKPMIGWLSAFVMASLLLLGSTSAYGQFQRMRIPAGTHQLRPTKNNVASIRAICVDASRAAPKTEHILRPASSSQIRVARWKKGHPDEVIEQSVTEVVGRWIDFRGSGSDASLDVVILDPSYEYQIRVGRDVPGILGPPSEKTPTTSEDADSLISTLTKGPASAAMQKLDDFEIALTNLFGVESTELLAFRDFTTASIGRNGRTINHVLQEVEAPDEVVSKFLDAARAGLVDELGFDSDHMSADSLYRFAAYRSGRALNSAELDAIKVAFELEQLPEPPKGLEEEIAQFRGDSELVGRLIAPTLEEQFRKELLKSIVDSNSYESAIESTRSMLLTEVGLAPERLSPHALLVAYTLYKGTPLEGRDAEGLKRLFGHKPEGDLPRGIEQAAKDLSLLRESFDNIDAQLAQEVMLDSLLAGHSDATARRMVARRILDSNFESLRGTRNPIRLAEILYPEALEDRQRDLLRNWLSSLKGIQTDYRDLAVLMLSRDKDGNLEVVVRGEKSHSRFPLDSFTSEALSEKHGHAQIVVTPVVLYSLLRELPEEARSTLKRRLVPVDAFLHGERQAAFIQESDGDVAVSRHVNADPDNRMYVETIRLKGEANQGLGDGILVHFPNDRILLIDTANDREGLGRIEQRLAAHQATRVQAGRPLRIDVLVTHDDRDHIAGLTAILSRLGQQSASGMEIGSIIFGFYTADSKLASDILAQIRNRFEVETERPHLVVGRHPEFGKEKDALKIDATFHDDVSVLKIAGVGNAEVEVVQVKSPGSRNDSSLVVQLEHNGVTQLLTGDIEIEGMLRLLQSDNVDLRADVLKWPHHRSFPSDWTPAERQVVRTFLMAVSPHTVVISNTGAKQTEQTERELIRFLHDVLDDPVSGNRVRIETTNDVLDPTTNEVVPGKTRQRITRQYWRWSDRDRLRRAA